MGCCKSTPRVPGQHENGFQDMGPRPHSESPLPVSGHHSPQNVQLAQGSTPPMIADPNTGSGPPIVFEPPEVRTEANPITPASSGGIDEHMQEPPATHGGLMAETREEPWVISNKQGPSGSSSSSSSTSNSSNANNRGKV
ncbi:hypothetical protein BKA56DRAFT_667477 [Ilyonectria sp. MPI-CAGE-AT-0026]|nr:hypothetical protein BKA56DRAFT_667477 [Ilyonectria sp. MPI-CAGE-AT-0026]